MRVSSPGLDLPKVNVEPVLVRAPNFLEAGVRMLAYIDGGTGGMMLQVLLGGIAGIAVLVKASLGGFFGGGGEDEEEAEPTESEIKPS